ncbi:fungal-specific transcription factor domain-containing protein [Apiosordaria backusii]|uniref:Fungal-specific transcription factor domain-containing protein n=1 Tax=Apiosordaria backusii TaxID=314023 RepID=A0AA40EN71_9PEZI|nr:fungal-specific transcription factor domain-containing protein [Apiosordaria backusii]
MSASIAVPRTAPIAIAPKPPANRFPPSRQGSVHLLDSSYRSGFNSPDSGSVVSGSHSSNTPPCEACRSRRTDCVMSEDADDHCVACQYSGTECSLVDSPPGLRKRKLNGVDSVEEGRSKRSSPGRSDNRQQRRRQNQHHQQPSVSCNTTSSSLIEDMANFGGPTLLKRTLGLQADRYCQYIGPTTDFEPSLINLSSFDPQDESLLARGTLRRVSDNDTFLLLPDHNTPGYDHIFEDADEIENIVAPHGRRLIDLYFRVVHPGFPIIQRNVFLEKYERSHREFSPPLLAAVYILAINWWEHEEELSGLPKPNVRELERLVRTTLADAMYRPKLSTIQAGLLLSQRPEGDQWAPTAQLVAVGQELGLHLDCTNWKIPPWERGLRKRLAWALYLQDKWGALVHGRPSHIFASNWAVQPLNPNDFPDVEWDETDNEERLELERGRVLFRQMVELSQILAEILDTFYTLQATQQIANAGPQGTQLVLSLAKPIQLKLKEWYSALPAVIRMDSTFQTTPSSSSGSRFSPIGYLHLAYFATEITLHRRIIRSMSSPDDNSSPSPSQQQGGGIDPYIQHICRSAAKARLISAMDFVNRLTPSHLRAFWYFASKTNFALIGTFGSLLWGTSPGREEAEWYRRRLGEYRWTLSVSSKPGEGTSKGLTEFAMGMLDISTGLLKQLPEKPLLSRSGSEVGFGGLGGVEQVRRSSLFALGHTGQGGAGG